MNKNKIEIVILGGSGLIGKCLIKEFLNKNTKILNLDLTDKISKNENYFFEKFNMTNNDLEKKLSNIFKKYQIPRVFIDCSYLNRVFFKNTSIKKISKNNLDLILKNWLSSSVVITGYFLNKMKKSNIKGSIILTSSIYGVIAQDTNIYKRTGMVDNIAYTIVKSSINNFVKNAAVMFGEFGIKVNSICPGGVYSKKDKNFKNKIFIKNYISKVPLRRFAKPEDLVSAYMFLASKKNSYITGVNLMVDGGFTLT